MTEPAERLKKANWPWDTTREPYSILQRALVLHIRKTIWVNGMTRIRGSRISKSAMNGVADRHAHRATGAGLCRSAEPDCRTAMRRTLGTGRDTRHGKRPWRESRCRWCDGCEESLARRFLFLHQGRSHQSVRTTHTSICHSDQH